MMRQIHHIHFVGIGGSGMNGIAEVMLNLGYKVTGSDVQVSTVTQHLTNLGAAVFQGHASQHITDADVVVVSSAIDVDNPEVEAARTARIPLVPRAQMLAELMRFRHGIAIAGTHGKTTTTSLIASLMAEGDLDPTYVIGGRLNSSGSNAKLGASQYLVVEADESDASFLQLQPMVSVVTNIEPDHMATYGGDFEQLKRVFVQFLQNLPFYGLAVVCDEHPVVREVIPDISRPLERYGLNDKCDIYAEDIRQEGLKTHYRVMSSKMPPLDITLNLPGIHNVLNSLAAIAVAREHGVAEEAIQRGLAGFQGVGRRTQYLGDFDYADGQVTLFDDYGHHPSEIDATINAIRAGLPERRTLMLFQPHRYSRTRDLFDDFVKVLSKVDILLLLNVYPAGEAALPDADSRALAKSIRQRGKVDPILIEDKQDLPDILSSMLKAGDVLMTQGAGDISKIASELVEKRLNLK